MEEEQNEIIFTLPKGYEDPVPSREELLKALYFCHGFTDDACKQFRLKDGTIPSPGAFEHWLKKVGINPWAKEIFSMKLKKCMQIVKDK